MRRLFVLLCLLFLFPASALGASSTVATYKYSDGSMMTLCVRDTKHVRMDTSPTSYMLLADGKVYSVNKDDQGNWQVFDMDQMGAMASGSMSMFGGGDDTPTYEVLYQPTGKKEKVAGYTGKVYTAVVLEDGKVTSRDEVVLSNHSNMKKVNDGWVAMATRMGKSMGKNMAKSIEQATQEAQKKGYGGTLRYGTDMVLKSLSIRNLNDSYYKLPANAQQTHPMQTSQPPQQQETDSSGLKDDAKEIGVDAKEATKDEIKNEVRDLIGNIFN